MRRGDGSEIGDADPMGTTGAVALRDLRKALRDARTAAEQPTIERIFCMGRMVRIIEKPRKKKAPTTAGRALLEHVARTRALGGALDWQPRGVLVAAVKRGSRRLGFTIARPSSFLLWIVQAIETGDDLEDVTQPVSIQRLAKDRYEHEVFPPCQTLGEAVALAERYAAWWRGSRKKLFTMPKGAGEFGRSGPPRAKARKR